MARNASATLATVCVVACVAFALYAMTVGRLRTAGLSFLSASILIYLREIRLT